MRDVKKFIIQISFILAGILLQAHAILPHIHHNGVVCFVEKQAQHCCKCGENPEANYHKSHHHHNGDLDDCDLKQVIIRQNDVDNNVEQSPSPDFLSLYYLIYPLNEFYLDIPHIGLQFNPKPYLQTYTTPLVGSFKSLRAPPVSSFLG